MIRKITQLRTFRSRTLPTLNRATFTLVVFALWYSVSIANLIAQPTKQWDNTLGGDGNDILYSGQQTTDGGYILGGISESNVASGDKSQNGYSLNGADFWLIKLDATGKKVWDKTIGGNSYELLHSVQQTADGGYILGGSSSSNVSGDKSGNSFGGGDYWVVKLNSAGIKEWDKTYGGTGEDNLINIQQTKDGGYILGGGSKSNAYSAGGKSESARGVEDYWVLKINSAGTKEWDKTLGGSYNDQFKAVRQTTDGGYIVGGWSESNAGGDKSDNVKGTSDYWVVKLSASGQKEWDKSFGGSDYEEFGALLATPDGGCIMGGWSVSPISGDKSVANKGTADFWVVKLNAAGNKEWDNTYGGGGSQDVTSIQLTKDGGYILGGKSYAQAYADKTENSRGVTDYWVVKITASGKREWDKTLGGDLGDELSFVQQTNDGGYFMGGKSHSNLSGDKSESRIGAGPSYLNDYWVVKLSAYPTTERTITTKDLDSPGFCIGGDPLIFFTTTGSFSPSEIFQVQLSDPWGSFASPVIIGEGTASPIQTIISYDTPPGKNYRIRVVSSSLPIIIGTDNGTNLGTSYNVLGQPFFYGPTDPCPGTRAVYTASDPELYKNLNWTVPNGWTIVSGQGTPSITVTVGVNQGLITLSGDSFCGNHMGYTSVNPSVVPTQLTAISANTNTVCVGGTVVYTVKPSDQNYSYTNGSYVWQLPFGWTMISGQGTNSITVKAGSEPGIISVNFVNNCSTSSPQTLTVASTILQPPLTISRPICGPGLVTLTASGAPTTGFYRWYTSLSSGTPIPNATSATFTTPVLTATTRYYVSVVNGNCESARTEVTAYVNPIPKILVTTNATTVSSSGAATLTASGAITYVWSPATGLSSNIGASVIAKPTATTTYNVTGTDSMGCISTAAITITVNTSGLQMQTITFPPIPDKVYGDAPFTLNATSSAGLSLYYRIMSGPATVSGKTLTMTGVGTVTVRAYHPGNDRYLAATPVDVTFKVLSSSSTKQSQTISFAALPPKTFGVAPFPLNATTTSGLPVSFSILAGPATISGNIITLTGAGTVTVRAMQTGNEMYAAANPVDQSFTINKASQSINFPALANKTYGDTPVNLTATATSGLPVSFKIVSGPASVSGNMLTIIGAGTVTVQAEQIGNVNYLAASPVPSSFVVLKAIQTITMPTIPDKTFNDAPFTLTATASSGLPVSYSIVSGPATVSGNTVTLTGVGTVTVRATQAGNINFNPTSADKSFAVKSAEPVLTGCNLALTSKVTQAEPWYGMWGPTTGAGAIDLTVSGGTAPYSYKWSTGLTTQEVLIAGQTSQDLAIAAPGIYTVMVTDAKGCIAKAVITVGRKNDPISLAASQINVSTIGGRDGSVDVSVVGGISPFTYRWSNGAATEDLTGLAAGQYTVTVTDAFGKKVSITVQILAPGTTTALTTNKNPASGDEFLIKETDLQVYPNPAADRTTVSFSLETTGKYTLNLYDLKGSKAKTIAAGKAAGKELIMVDMEVGSYPKGIYLLQLVTEKGRRQKRIAIGH